MAKTFFYYYNRVIISIEGFWFLLEDFFWED